MMWQRDQSSDTVCFLLFWPLRRKWNFMVCTAESEQTVLYSVRILYFRCSFNKLHFKSIFKPEILSPWVKHSKSLSVFLLNNGLVLIVRVQVVQKRMQTRRKCGNTNSASGGWIWARGPRLICWRAGRRRALLHSTTLWGQRSVCWDHTGACGSPGS